MLHAFKPIGPYNACTIGGNFFDITSDGGELPVAVGPVVGGRNTGRERYKLLLAHNDGSVAEFYAFRLK